MKGSEVQINREKTPDLIVVGGGAAGFYTALTAAEADPSLKIALIEPAARVLAKVRVSGGGRCNVTHDCMDPKQLTAHYPRGARELLGPFHQWGPRQMITWLKERGVQLKTESDGRMFPITDSSQTIIDCFTNCARRLGIQVWTGVGFRSAVPDSANAGWTVTLTDEQQFSVKWLHIATGGLRNGKLKDWIEKIGHTIQPLAPSLFTLNIPENTLRELAGVSVASGEVVIPGTRLKQKGPILLTHWGVSGPAVLKLSAWAARWIHEREDQFEIQIQWNSSMNSQEAFEWLKNSKKNNAKKNLGTVLFPEIPRRLWKYLLQRASVSESVPWAQISDEKLRVLARTIGEDKYQVSGKSMNKEEFVTCGGVTLKEIDFKTMTSRVASRLSFSGEVLDIDGVTGGFNFQAAWTTSHLAGQGIAKLIHGGEAR